VPKFQIDDSSKGVELESEGFEQLMDSLVIKMKKVMPSACSNCRCNLDDKSVFVTEKHHFRDIPNEKDHMIKSHYRGYCIPCYEKLFDTKIDEDGYITVEKNTRGGAT